MLWLHKLWGLAGICREFIGDCSCVLECPSTEIKTQTHIYVFIIHYMFWNKIRQIGNVPSAHE